MNSPIMFLPLMAVLFVVIFNAMRHWLGLNHKQVFVLSIGSLILALLWNGEVASAFYKGDLDRPVLMVSWLLCRFFLVVFAVSFAVKAYQSWLGIHVSAGERSPGLEGLRAWLSPGKLILAVIVATCASFGYGYHFFAVLAFLIAILLIQPMINSARVELSHAEPYEAFSAERKKVLSLLEVGKITAEESADLLNALASTSQPAPAATHLPIDGPRRFLVFGAGLLMLAFVLPWFSIDPHRELNRLTGTRVQFPLDMENTSFQIPGLDSAPVPFRRSPVLHVSGGAVPNGLGWLVLLLGLAAAALPCISMEIGVPTRRLLALAMLGIGGLLMVYLSVQYSRFLSFGLLLALVAYAMEFIGIMRSRPVNHSLASNQASAPV